MGTTGAALVVHDLKNALGDLEAGLQALAQRPDRRAAAAAYRRCRELRQRLVGYLTLYGHDAPDGRLRAVFEDESPEGLLQTLAARHRDAPLPVRVAAAGEAPVVWPLDRHLVLLALEAALHNALRYAGSAVTLRARAEDGHLVLSVQDDGPGPQGGRPAVGTTGLGTALCRAVARAHGTQREDGGARLLPGPSGGALFELWLAT
jgi:signal transduction histidine kinase